MATPAQFYDQNGELRMDGSLVGGGGSQTVSATTTDLTAAQLKALAAAAVQLVAAPGAGRALVPLGIFIQVKFGTVAFTDPATADICVVTASNLVSPANIYWEFLNGAFAPPSPASALFTQTNDAYWIGAAPSLNSPITASAPIDNAPLGLVNYGGNLAAGDGSARFSVYYAVATLA